VKRSLADSGTKLILVASLKMADADCPADINVKPVSVTLVVRSGEARQAWSRSGSGSVP